MPPARAIAATGRMLRVGIPGYRLPRETLDQEVDYLKEVEVIYRRTEAEMTAYEEEVGRPIYANIIMLGALSAAAKEVLEKKYARDHAWDYLRVQRRK